MTKKQGIKKESLDFQLKNLWSVYSKKEEKDVMTFAENYKVFLDLSKTEREVYDFMLEKAQKNGFSEKLTKGAKKIIIGNREKALAIVYLGKLPLTKGFRLIGAHIDSPRLDLKQKPFFEDTNISLLKTHYYGGVKKYQWVSRPLAIHGVVVKENGEKVRITVGEDEKDPVFVIPDLLPHLARKIQDTKKANEIVIAENLNLIASQKEVIDEEEKRKLVKFLLTLLNEKYGINEEDFVSADIEIVPADKAKDVGFDRTFIGAYGHDDRVCGYSAFKAISDLKEQPQYTSIAFFVDKEEIGSDGPTGAQSNFILDIIVKLLSLQGKKTDLATINEIFNNSEALSGDVNAAVNPMYKEVHEINNAAISGYGVILTKFTGSGGKYSSNEATAEFTAKIRKIFNSNNVHWQFGELGKVDEGGGGTIAKCISKWGISTIDCGPGILGMHSPYEIVSKADLYETYKAYKGFFLFK
jgi:aspartyl aminopeptidase